MIDSHAHLTSHEVFPHLGEILARAKTAGLQSIVNICTDVESLEKAFSIKHTYPWIYSSAATTPHDVEKNGEAHFEYFAEHARQGGLIAIGETGLDYHYAHSPKPTQKKFLIKYLHLALECSLPVVIHCRDAFSDFFDILDLEYKNQGRHGPGVLHCFTGNKLEAEEVFKRGWYLSLSGIVTFKKSHELKEIAKDAPLGQLLIETDAPYLAPQSKRGKPNEPAFLLETAACIAEIKGLSLQELQEATSRNARLLFKI